MNRDPYKYFRVEARELLGGLERGALELEKGSLDPALRQQLMRLAHTLKGAARVVRQQPIADRSHAFEDALEPYRERSQPVPAEVLAILAEHLRGIAAQVDALGPVAPAVNAAPAPASPVFDERFETVRVEIAAMDALLEGVAEEGVRVAALSRETALLEDIRRLAAAADDQLRLPPGRYDGTLPAALIGRLGRARGLLDELQDALARSRRGIGDGLERAEAGLRRLRERANTLRLVPAAAVFPTLERAAVDAARQLGKDVDFHAGGGEHQLDGHVLGPLRDALLHCVRNAVDHGIESAAERRARGKTERGSVELSVERRGNRIVFRCRDDGRGIDLDSVRRAAVAHGRLDAAAAAALDNQGAAQLLLEGGFSSREQITQISGRGIGLDVVRETAERLHGRLALRSEPGQYTELEIDVPLSLSSLGILLVEAGGRSVGVPVDQVRETLRVAQTSIAATPDGEQLLYQGEVLPYAALAQLFDASAGADLRAQRTVVIVDTPGGRAGLGVDRLLGCVDSVVRPLPAAVGAIALVSGVAFDADGNPQPVLDPDGAVAAARAGGRGAAAAPAQRLPILVIDDSLTTRMLEQNILEAAGYTVDLAVSGEDGMEKALQRRYALFVVDIEMPGMNGFEFIRRTRADARLRATPAVLVTSIATPESRQQGLEAGASAYIVKGEFEQGVFMDTVRRLTEAADVA